MALCLYPHVICRWWAPRGFSGREWLLHLPCRRVSCCVTDGFRGKWPANHVTSFLPHFPGETSMDRSPGRWHVPLPVVLGLIAHCDQIVLPRTSSHCLTEEPQRQCLAWFIEPGSSVTSGWLQPSVELSRSPQPCWAIPASLRARWHPSSLLGPRGSSPGVPGHFSPSVEIVLLLPRASSIPSHSMEVHCGLSYLWAHHFIVLFILFSHICPKSSGRLYFLFFFFGKNWASVLLIRNPSSAWHMVVDTQMLVLVHLVFPRWVFRVLFFLEGFHGDLSYSHLNLYFFFSGWSLNRDALLTRWWSFPCMTPSELKPSPTSSTKVCLWSLGVCYPSYWVDTAATCYDYMME